MLVRAWLSSVQRPFRKPWYFCLESKMILTIHSIRAPQQRISPGNRFHRTKKRLETGYF